MSFLRSKEAGVAAVCVLAWALGAGCSTGKIEDLKGGLDGQLGGAAGTGTSAATGAPSAAGLNRNLKCDPMGLGSAPVRRLSHVEYNRTVADLFPGVTVPVQVFPADLAVHGLENNATQLNPSPVLVEQYNTAAGQVAQLAVAQRDKILPCMPSGLDMGCASQAIASLGLHAFRRPLTSDEQTRYEGLFAKQMNAISWNGALELTVSAMLQAPAFLYRIEFGDTTKPQGAELPLEDYEIASRLSYFLWQSMPDQALFDAAKRGELRTPTQIETQARRMLSDQRASAAIVDFHRQWLDFDRLLTQNKDPATYPNWSDTLRDDMRQESDRFVRYVFEKGSGTVNELLTSNTSFATKPLADLYGVSVAKDWDMVDLPATERAGILTQGTFLASRAHTTNGSPPLRGVSILDQLLCDRPPPPPPSANTATPTSDPKKPKTNRQLFEERTAPTLCQGCHKQINGIGFGLEAFDSVGAFRSTDNGMPVDPSGQLVGTDVDGKYGDAVELANKLGNSRQVQYCVVRNWYRYAYGRDEASDEWCKLDALDAALEKAGGDVRELLVQITTSHEFMFRPEGKP